MHSKPVYLRLSLIALLTMIRGWRHSLATLLAVVCGYLAICLFDGYVADIQKTFELYLETQSMLGQLIIERQKEHSASFDNEWINMLDESEMRRIDEILLSDPDILVRVRFLAIKGVIHAAGNSPYFIGYGYDVAEGATARGTLWKWNTFAGSPLHLFSANNAVVLGGQMGLALSCTYPFKADFIGPAGNYLPEPRPFECPSNGILLSATTEFAQVNVTHMNIAGFVNGMFDEIDKYLIHMPLSAAWALYDTHRVSFVAIHLKDAALAPQVMARIQSVLAGAALPAVIKSTRAHALGALLNGGLQILAVFRHLFLSVMGVIAVLAVYTTMAKSVRERFREIGTLRSLGFYRHHLTFMFAMEGGCLGLAACAIGLALTLGIARLVALSGITYDAGIIFQPIPLTIGRSPTMWLISAIAFTSLTTITGYLASRKACHTVIADAMRHVE